MSENFTIISFKWCKEIADNQREAGVIYHTDEFILERLKALASFFESNGLVTRKLLNKDRKVNEDFVFEARDLTPLGLQVLRAGYKKWASTPLKRTASDVSAFENALKKLSNAPLNDQSV
jgi:hypothetical protein